MVRLITSHAARSRPMWPVRRESGLRYTMFRQSPTLWTVGRPSVD
jgi:hypothetical protein